MQLSNKTYDVLKWVAQILLPAVSVFYLGMAKIWGLPFGDEIVATITALDLLLGMLLGLSNTMYLKSVADEGALYKFMMTLTQEELNRVNELAILKAVKIEEQKASKNTR